MNESEQTDRESLAPLLEALRRRTGDDFTRFQNDVLDACVRNRLSARGAATLADYVASAKEDPAELEHLFRELARGASGFFRDGASFDYLAEHVVPELARAASESGRPVRVWVPACASGEEAYSLAMLFLEHSQPAADRGDVQILATDIDEQALERARRAVYPQDIEHEISAERLARFFVREDEGYRLTEPVQALCSFSHHNLGDAPPAAHLDLVSCRYVFPYFEHKLRRQVLPAFHAALRPGGYLFLGPVEDVGGAGDLFEAVEPAHGVFRALAEPGAVRDDSPSPDREAGGVPGGSRQERSIAEKLESINARLDHANRDLRFRLSQVETMLDLVPVGVVLYEHGDRSRFIVNRAGSAILGLSDHTSRTLDPQGPRPYRLRRGERLLDSAELPLWRAVETGEPVDHQTLCVVREDGSERDILVSATPLVDDDGTVRGALSAFTDITEQVDEKRELRASAAAQSAVNRLSLYALSESDVARVAERAVRTVAETLNVEVAEVFRKLPGEDSLVLEAGVGWPDELVGDARIPGGKSSQAGYTLSVGAPVVVEDAVGEIRFSTPAVEADLPTRSGVSVVIHASKGPYGVLGARSARPRRFGRREVDFLQTVANLLGTALHRAHIEKQLAASHERLELGEARKAAERAEQLASIGTLAAGIAHEINNPLNSILVNAELGLLRLDSGENGEQLRETLETITNEVRRCADITRRVLLLAKDSDTPKAPHDLNEVVKKATELVHSSLQMEDAVVKLELGELPPLLLDPVSMESAVVNLLRNAAQAGPPGVTIEARTWEGSEHVHLSIADDGPGMDAEVLENIFTPFFSTKRGSKGTGLGLALVHRTVSNHEGRVDVRSRPGEGTVFEIRLPRHAPGGEESPED